MVRTRDRGDVVIPEPWWCDARYHSGLVDFYSDIEHTGPETVMTVDLPERPMFGLDMHLTQRPYGQGDRAVLVLVDLDQAHALDVDGLHRYAAALVGRAFEAELMALWLGEIRGGRQ